MAAEPMARVASANGSLQLSQPRPDLHSPTDGFASHVERLEKHAERMSSSGSDIGEEIRKLQLEDRQQSRRPSQASHAHVEADNARPVPVARSRNTSMSSYANSIVDVNSQARWGGYSPSAYVTSPKSSVRSGSWPHRPALQRQQSASNTSQSNGSPLDCFPETSENVDDVETAVHNPHNHDISQFSAEYDRIVKDMELGQVAVPSQESAPASGALERGMLEHDELPDRPATPDTFHQAQTVFQDFDGVHCAPTAAGTGEVSAHGRHAMVHSVPYDGQSRVPALADGMVYYPAPVPKMLNLPKRLSQLPPENAHSKRRSQMLGAMSPEARNSALWLGGGGGGGGGGKKPEKRSSVDLNKPRTSTYFDQSRALPGAEIKGESAQATLDGILDASTTAPVGAFTDHPLAGPVGKAVFGKEDKRRSVLEKRKSSTILLDTEAKSGKRDQEKRKSSFSFLLGRRGSTDDELSKHRKKESVGGKTNKLQKRNGSPMSLSNALEQNAVAPQQEHPRTASSQGSGINEPTAHRPAEIHANSYNGMEPLSHSESEQYDDEGQLDDDDDCAGPPSTLLAELQMRKTQQRERNRTAATAFPNGMHSTLLQLDAVAEIEKRKRRNQRVNLAWEVPGHGDEDDDVPLAMLFPARNGLVSKAGAQQLSGRADDWDRPLGLLEKKELEDSEPLSRRRNRLRGLHPDTPYAPDTTSPGTRMTIHTSHSHGQYGSEVDSRPGPPPDEAESADEEEPLAVRRERLKRKETLNAALGDVHSLPISGDFASEMMSQLGGLGEGKEKGGAVEAAAASKAPGSVNEEEETLGQRRARLQAEALARGGTTSAALSPGSPLRPPLKTSRSLADILSAHPSGHQAGKVSNDALTTSLPQGSLLQRNEQKTAHRQANIRDGNRRSTSYQLERPLVNMGPVSDEGLKSPTLDGQSGERGLLGKDSGSGLLTASSRRRSVARPLDKRASTMTLGPNNMKAGDTNLGMNLPALNQNAVFNPRASMMGMPMAVPMQMPMPMPMLGMNMPVQTPMSMGMGMNMGMVGAGMAGFPGGQLMMGQPYGMQMGMPMGMGMGMGVGMGVGNQMQMDPAIMDAGRRAAIDRWRQDVS